MSRFIPLSIPNFEGNERKYVDDAIDQGWVSTGGAYITKLEEQMAGFLHVEKVAACQSGTSALHLSLLECNVQPGDMVIVPTLTFIAAVNPVHYQFAEPVFMDCDASLCMDPVKLRRFCEKECHVEQKQLIHTASGKKIKAVIVVHVFGNLADMESIMDIAEEYHLKVIEDATEALGSHYIEGRFAGKYAGTIGDFGAYSFNGNKIITTGGGDTVPATVGGAFTATGRFVNHNYNASTQYGFDSANYGLYVDVANGTKNYALYSPNAAVRAAAVYGDTLNVVSITGSTYKLDMSKGNIIMIRANREYNVNLPNAHDVASMFGYKSLPTYFAIHVRIMIHPDTSGVTISGYFRPNNTVNQSVYLHPGNSMGFLVTNYPSFRWVETDYAGQ